MAVVLVDVTVGEIAIVTETVAALEALQERNRGFLPLNLASHVSHAKPDPKLVSPEKRVVTIVPGEQFKRYPESLLQNTRTDPLQLQSRNLSRSKSQCVSRKLFRNPPQKTIPRRPMKAPASTIRPTISGFLIGRPVAVVPVVVEAVVAEAVRARELLKNPKSPVPIRPARSQPAR